jgi:hypothetical protein
MLKLVRDSVAFLLQHGTPLFVIAVTQEDDDLCPLGRELQADIANLAVAAQSGGPSEASLYHLRVGTPTPRQTLDERTICGPLD